MTKPLEAQFYFGAVIDHDGECQRVSDEEAQFWTVYERNADGLSSAICDCTHRNDAVAATERFNALIAALEQSQQYAKDRDAENQDLMLTVGRLRVDREASQLAVKLPRVATVMWHLSAQAKHRTTAENVSDVLEALRAAGITVQGDE